MTQLLPAAKFTLRGAVSARKFASVAAYQACARKVAKDVFPPAKWCCRITLYCHPAPNAKYVSAIASHTGPDISSTLSPKPKGVPLYQNGVYYVTGQESMEAIPEIRPGKNGPKNNYVVLVRVGDSI